MRELALREIQMIELQILLDFKEVCEKFNLTFYLCGGTLLGAVRHKGFIPWDDDIDIMMPRPDYDKLMDLEKTKNILPDYLKLYSYEVGNIMSPFAKIVNTKTHIFQQYIENESLSHLWIDIMPVDGLPNDEVEVERIYQKVGILRKMLSLCWAKSGEGTTNFKKIIKYPLIPIARLFGANYWCKKIDKIARRFEFEKSKYVGAVSWGLYGIGERCLKEKFIIPIEVEFEGYKLKAISCWDEYLTGLYGDYMKLPPESKRKVHLVKAWLDE